MEPVVATQPQPRAGVGWLRIVLNPQCADPCSRQSLPGVRLMPARVELFGVEIDPLRMDQAVAQILSLGRGDRVPLPVRGHAQRRSRGHAAAPRGPAGRLSGRRAWSWSMARPVLWSSRLLQPSRAGARRRLRPGARAFRRRSRRAPAERLSARRRSGRGRAGRGQHPPPLAGRRSRRHLQPAAGLRARRGGKRSDPRPHRRREARTC